MHLFTVAFFGHRFVDNMFRVEELLEKHIHSLVRDKEYVEFLVGKNGDFDQIVSSTVRRCKRKYRDDNSAHVLILPYASSKYTNNQEYYEDYYDEIEVSHKASISHPKAAIQIRNREMVDRSNLIICYVKEKSGGAYQTIQYAKRMNKNIINLAEEDE